MSTFYIFFKYQKPFPPSIPGKWAVLAVSQWIRPGSGLHVKALSLPLFLRPFHPLC